MALNVFRKNGFNIVGYIDTEIRLYRLEKMTPQPIEQAYNKPLLPVYFNSDQLENLISFYGQYSIQSETKTKTKKEKSNIIEVDGNAGIKTPRWLPIINANVEGSENYNRESLKAVEQESQALLFRTKFSLLYDLRKTLFEQNLIKKVNSYKDYEALNNHDLVEIPITVLKQSLIDLVTLLQKMWMYKLFMDDEGETIAKIQQGNFNSSDAGIFGILSDVVSEITKSNTSEILCGIGTTGIKSILLCEKNLFIGELDKIISNDYIVLGKVVSIRRKNEKEYNLIDSTIFSTLGEENIKKLEQMLKSMMQKMRASFKNANRIKDINISDLIFIKAPAFKIIPIAIYA